MAWLTGALPIHLLWLTYISRSHWNKKQNERVVQDVWEGFCSTDAAQQHFAHWGYTDTESVFGLTLHDRSKILMKWLHLFIFAAKNSNCRRLFTLPICEVFLQQSLADLQWLMWQIRLLWCTYCVSNGSVQLASGLRRQIGVLLSVMRRPAGATQLSGPRK